MFIAPPPKADHGFYTAYLSLAPETDLITALQTNLTDITTLANSLTEEQLLYRYDTGKWNIKEILVHFIDAERNFCYRIMRISRGDQAILPVFDVHAFVTNSFATERDMASIMDELTLTRQSTIAMFAGMNPAMLDRTGPARDTIISVRALGFTIVGHVIHHINIINERYLHKK